jgi:hypothetical protein
MHAIAQYYSTIMKKNNCPLIDPATKRTDAIVADRGWRSLKHAGLLMPDQPVQCLPTKSKVTLEPLVLSIIKEQSAFFRRGVSYLHDHHAANCDSSVGCPRSREIPKRLNF